MTNVLQIPGNIEILHHLYSEEVRPAHTTLRSPITPDALLSRQDQWAQFDVINLHTVELTSMDALRKVIDRARELRKRTLFTMHEVTPNIEADIDAFEAKTRFIVENVDGVIALTQACADLCQQKYADSETDIVVIPHGQPFATPVIDSYTEKDSPDSIAAYGALRTYRSYTDLLNAWLALDAASRPSLKIYLRGVNDVEQQRYAQVIGELKDAEGEDGYSLEISESFIPKEELISWLRLSDTLALPYQAITHSGQIETALDLGMTVVAPDVTTLRSQIEHHPRGELVTFVGQTALSDKNEYGKALLRKPNARNTVDMTVNAVKEYRAKQLIEIKQKYAQICKR